MEHLLAPERTITVDGKPYVLDGSFRTLKAIQHAFECEILRFLTLRVGQLPFDEAAKLVRLAIPDDPPPLEAVEREIVEEIGILEARRLLGEWLLMATTPRRDREKKMAELAEALTTGPSRGRNTRSSV